MRKAIAALCIAAGVVAVPPLSAAAAGNPAGTGQPSVECDEEGATSAPKGFATDGFAIAEERYAGAGGSPSAANGNPHAVSQYDVACYQLTQHGH